MPLFSRSDPNPRTKEKTRVMAGSSPFDKYFFVKSCRSRFEEVVAVTGDGSNGAPVLHEADIGLSMGSTRTEVAKESADVIVLRDNFLTIVTVAEWGRSVLKFLQFQFTVYVVALVINFISTGLSDRQLLQLGCCFG